MKKANIMSILLSLSIVVGLLALPVNAEEKDDDNYPNDLKITSHNVYMLSQNLYPNWGQVKRAGMIADADYVEGNDVIIFNELFDNEASDELLNQLEDQYPHQTPVLGRSKDGWDETQGSYSNLVPEDGGVGIVSKWPIAEKIQYVYEDACSADGMSNKGFVYVKVMKEGKPYHVIGTHTQATDSLCLPGQPEDVRQKQFQDIHTFIEDKEIPEDEVIFIGGDLNAKKNSDEYNEMLDALHASNPSGYTGFDATWDPETNSIAGYNYPDLDTQFLDYILVDKDHAQPNDWYIHSHKIKSEPWSVTLWGQTYEYNDYSDHYPITGSSDPITEDDDGDLK